MKDIEKELQEIINRKNIFKDEPMEKHTSFKIGGTADYFIKITSLEELKAILDFTKQNNIPLTIVGNGTNILVREAGIRGIVIKLELKDFKIRRLSHEILITAEAGMTIATLANIALKEEISGLEFLSGIPGTIGRSCTHECWCLW